MMNSLLASSQTQTTPSPLIENPVWSALDDIAQVDWLILHFNQCFAYENVVLVRGDDEPEYFPAHAQQPARIQFAHGFLAVHYMKSVIGALQGDIGVLYPI